jgi:hypothetical protein
VLLDWSSLYQTASVDIRRLHKLSGFAADYSLVPSKYAARGYDKLREALPRELRITRNKIELLELSLFSAAKIPLNVAEHWG